MNANFVWDVWETCENEHLSDVQFALPIVAHEQGLPDGYTEEDVSQYISRHYDTLVEAYKSHDREHFAEVVAVCDAKDAAGELT